ncbi:zinc finger HIT domain-containing protein 3-like isoform X2 [Branchiostoma floridae]|uniref:Zinc finger HIT domain-containing protein 3 n=1 Tax=Branchiostoma floridae TaxID=7739 RepID=A0A9J7KXJ5_BRAFL|nr:zinc finger HIT domain-containing protein 3-like isoform X2 [Branchiostoma floridae]
MAPETNVVTMVPCEVCSEQPPKYRCPRCEVRYCSLTCFKQHKVNTCGERGKLVQERRRKQQVRKQQCEAAAATVQEEENAVSMEMWDDGMDEGDEEDRVPLDRLQKLRDSEELQDLLCNPHLQRMIREVDSSDDPEVTMQRAMQEPIFVEFADQCLRVVEPQPNGTEQG